MGITAITLLPFISEIQHRADPLATHSGHSSLFCFFGGLGPLVTLAIFEGQSLVRRRFASQHREQTPDL
jgi:hypothetical protein